MITQKIIARTDSLKLDKIISRYGEDSMRQVVFIIVRPDPESEELIPITIPEDAVGSFRILKPSGNFVIVPMSKSVLATGETAFDVVLPASANTAKGSGYYDIRITSDTDKYYFTAQGDFLIDDNILSDEVLEDVSEVNGLVFPDDFLTVEDHVAYIDDETVSIDSTWSSDKISEEIEAHAGGDVSKTVSGNPVTFTDGAAAPLVKCTTAIQGNQDLHGYDKPWVGGSGKNKLPINCADSVTNSGIDYTVQKDDDNNKIGININGRSSPLSFCVIAGNGASNNNINSYSTTVYASGESIKCGSLPTGVSLNFRYTDGSYENNVQNRTITLSKNVGLVYLQVDGGVTVNNKIAYPIICASTETDPTFEPYSNICPITAYTEGEIEVRGKNVLPYTLESLKTDNTNGTWSGNTYSFHNVSFKINTDEKGNVIGIETSGTANANTTFYVMKDSNGSEFNGMTLNGCTNGSTNTYYIAFGENSSPYREFVDTGSGVDISGLEEKVGWRFYIFIANGKSANTTFYPMLRVSTDTDSTYEPYTSTTHTTAYSSAIYRGSEDCVNGEVTTIKKKVVFDGSNDENWQLDSSMNRFFIEDSTLGAKPKSAAISNLYENKVVNYWGELANGQFAIHPSANYIISLMDSRFSSVSDLRTAFATIPLEIAYEIETESEDTVTPTNLPIKSLFGYNHIESSTGDMEIEYITERFQPLIDSIKQL